ncbi:MAG: MFS transporter, partial [Treponema sp.]|nr:MFS transporter [Treponema sp.]
MNRRVTFLTLTAYGIGFFLGLENGGFQLVLLQIARSYNLDNIKMGALVTAQASAITIGPLLFGWLADRVGKKAILMIFMPLFAIGCFGAAFSTSALLFASSIFMSGIGYSVSESISSSALSDSFPGRESRYLNIMQCIFCLGAVLSPQIFSHLISSGLVTWRMVFLISGAGFIVLYPLLCLSGIAPSAAITSGNERHNSAPENKSVRTTRIAHNPLGVFTPLMLMLIVAMACYVAMEVGIAFFAEALYVTEYSNL